MRNQNPKLRGAELDKRLDVVDQLQALADSAGMTLHAMTMGWLIHHPGVTSILCGARTVAQAISNAESGDTVLPEGRIRPHSGNPRGKSPLTLCRPAPRGRTAPYLLCNNGQKGASR